MDIKKINAYSTQSLQRTQEQQRQLRGKEKTASQETTTDADRVQLSREYQEMSQLKKVLMERGEVRAERVDQLRNLIQNNLYEIDPEKIAGKMLDELL